jgi:hypothetical protein
METVELLSRRIGSTAGAITESFWSDATEPLKHLTLQTGVLVVVLGLLLWLLTRVVRSATWRFSAPVVRGLQIVSTAHSNTGTIALSIEDYIRKFAANPEIFLVNTQAKTARQRWIADRQSRNHATYFVVTLVERSPDAPLFLGRQVLLKELKVWMKAQPPQEGYVQLDGDCLREIRDNNSSSRDDVDGTVIEGQYDLYMRRVNALDIRHWLVHPNREIRIAVWVTLISMIVPVCFDALFG